jgi:hypothetical protein
MLAHTRSGLLRSSPVSQCCFLNWDQGSNKKSTPAVAARPPPSIPPASSSPQPQPSQVAMRAAAEQDVVVVPQPAVPVVPAGKLPPPSRSFWGEFAGSRTLLSLVSMLCMSACVHAVYNNCARGVHRAAHQDPTSGCLICTRCLQLWLQSPATAM